jgi:hypothetical protein
MALGSGLPNAGDRPECGWPSDAVVFPRQTSPSGFSASVLGN